MIKRVYRFLLISLLMAISGSLCADLPIVKESFGDASATTEGDRLFVTTGSAERAFQWTGHGFVTVGIRNIETGKQWANRQPGVGADWSYPGLIPEDAEAKLLSLVAQPGDDQGFTAKHLEVVAEILYPQQELTLKLTIWVYPGAPGFRQQLWAKGSAAGGEVINDTPQFKPLEAKIFTNREALKSLPAWAAATITAPEVLHFRVCGVDPDKRYQAGVSWLDYGNGGRKQSVEVSSVDGETRVEVIPATALPGSKSNWEEEWVKTFALPQEVNRDGTITLTVKKHAVASACISEIWLYEFGAKSAPAFDINPERKKQLEKSAPEGARLVAYLSGHGMAIIFFENMATYTL